MTQQTTSRFALMRHVPSGEAYAIEYADETDGRIVGIIGPLHYSQVRDSLGVVFPETSPHWLELQDALDGADALEDVDWAGTQQWELVTLIRARCVAAPLTPSTTTLSWVARPAAGASTLMAEPDRAKTSGHPARPSTPTGTHSAGRGCRAAKT